MFSALIQFLLFEFGLYSFPFVRHFLCFASCPFVWIWTGDFLLLFIMFSALLLLLLFGFVFERGIGVQVLAGVGLLRPLDSQQVPWAPIACTVWISADQA
jgi:hypothetical protein